MSTLHDVAIPDGQSGYQFYHAGKEYMIWAWLSELSTDVYSCCLAEVRVSPQGGYVLYNIFTESAGAARVDSAGGVQKFMSDIFLPKANEVLASKGGDANTFPIDKEHFEQFNWIFENALAYVNGQIVLSI